MLWEGRNRWAEPSLRSDNWWRSEGSVGLERRLFEAGGLVCLKVGKTFSEELSGVQWLDKCCKEATDEI